MNGIYGPPTCGIPGYPYAPEDWSEVEAIKTAHDEDVELGADHLELLSALQEYFSKHSRQGINTLSYTMRWMRSSTSGAESSICTRCCQKGR